MGYSEKHKSLNRYLYNKNKMTLAIGVQCKDGVVIVADRKVTDLENPQQNIFENKIELQQGSPIAFVASGLTDLYRQFNRKVVVKVGESIRETKIRNQEALKKVGMRLEDFEIPSQEPETIQGKEDIDKKPPEKKQESKSKIIEVPYGYTGEHFIADCKELMREIGKEGFRLNSNPLDLLIGLNAGAPALFHIDSYGHDTQINKYIAIGSGYPHVRIFFDRLWNSNMSVTQSALLASFVIKYVEKLRADPFVGCGDNDEFPQMVILLNDGRYGHYRFGNEHEILERYKETIKAFEKVINEIKIEDTQI